MTAALRPRHRLTVDDFDALIASGRLADARVELMDGDLVDLNVQGPVHASLTVWLHRLLEGAYGSGFHVRDHSPLRATTHDQPEPDLTLVRGAPRKQAPHPTGADVVLVMEVSVSSIPEDRAKAAAYARGGVAEYWLVDPEGGQVEVHRGPQPDGSGVHPARRDAGAHWRSRSGSSVSFRRRVAFSGSLARLRRRLGADRAREAAG